MKSLVQFIKESNETIDVNNEADIFTAISKIISLGKNEFAFSSTSGKIYENILKFVKTKLEKNVASDNKIKSDEVLIRLWGNNIFIKFITSNNVKELSFNFYDDKIHFCSSNFGTMFDKHPGFIIKSSPDYIKITTEFIDKFSKRPSKSSKDKFTYTYDSWKQIFNEIWEGEDWDYIEHDLSQYDFPFITIEDYSEALSISEIEKLYNDDKTKLKTTGKVEDEEPLKVKYKGKIYIVNVGEE